MSAEPKSLTLVHRYRPARNSDDPSTPLLILMHGVGSNEDDLFGLVPYIDPRFAIVSARAPKPYEYGGFSWFDLMLTPQGITASPESAEQGSQAVVAFVKEAQAAYGSAPERTILGGFSQGAIMSASVLLTEPRLVTGAVLMSGLVPPDLPLAPQTQLAGKPVLITHGEWDEVISVQFARASRQVLEALGLAVAYHEYPMGHALSEDCLEDIDRWLVARID